MQLSDRNVPPGWTYNPSKPSRRHPITALAAAGFCIASYLALYQLGVFSAVWEPFFGGGSETVLHSGVAKLLPVPDAALGALVYLADVVTSSVGGASRWRTMPWLVLLFGLIVAGLGVTAVLLAIFQPVLFHSWCTLCLASAIISISLVGLAMDEVLATLQHLKRQHSRGLTLWAVLRGKETAVYGDEETGAAPSQRFRDSFERQDWLQRKLSLWPHVASAALGVWLIVSPYILSFGAEDVARYNGQIMGPLVVAAAVISMSRTTRVVSWVNFALGLWLLLSPLLFDYTWGEAADSVLVGFLLLAFSLGRGDLRARFGGGWRKLITRSSEE